VLPRTTRTLEALRREGKLTSDPKTLRSFGFGRVHVAEDETPASLARSAAAALLEEGEIDPASVDRLFVGSALPEERIRRSRDPLSLFDYAATRLQSELGLRNAIVTAVHQAGCVSLFATIGMAADAIAADRRVRRVLCVGADVLPRPSRREILYNVISDGACAVLVERGAAPNRIVARRHVTKGFFWTARSREAELIATYFPTARRLIADTLSDAGLAPRDIALVLPHNVNRKSWDVLLDLTGLDALRLYDRNIATKGHTIAADPFINLRDATKEGRIASGDRLLLFSFGFGAHWAALVLEH
jgi:3-oxoacyl-[acyl-carrier-protein] synthase-3